MRDKRILPTERANDGACAVCGRRHIHTDACATLKRREDHEPKGWRDRDRRIESGL